ncbi:hypothetical protein CON64_17375 [Bacillus pseudomycoides]|nr:hypothetical protein CON64_17375 [Bacillus pseudomycoides]
MSHLTQYNNERLNALKLITELSPMSERQILKLAKVNQGNFYKAKAGVLSEATLSAMLDKVFQNVLSPISYNDVAVLAGFYKEIQNVLKGVEENE